MPSWGIHRKYGKMLGIREDIQRKVDELIDNSGHHDFYDFLVPLHLPWKLKRAGI